MKNEYRIVFSHGPRDLEDIVFWALTDSEALNEFYAVLPRLKVEGILWANLENWSTRVMIDTYSAQEV